MRPSYKSPWPAMNVSSDGTSGTNDLNGYLSLSPGDCGREQDSSENMNGKCWGGKKMGFRVC